MAEFIDLVGGGCCIKRLPDARFYHRQRPDDGVLEIRNMDEIKFDEQADYGSALGGVVRRYINFGYNLVYCNLGKLLRIETIGFDDPFVHFTWQAHEGFELTGYLPPFKALRLPADSLIFRLTTVPRSTVPKSEWLH